MPLGCRGFFYLRPLETSACARSGRWPETRMPAQSQLMGEKLNRRLSISARRPAAYFLTPSPLAKKWVWPRRLKSRSASTSLPRLS